MRGQYRTGKQEEGHVRPPPTPWRMPPRQLTEEQERPPSVRQQAAWLVLLLLLVAGLVLYFLYGSYITPLLYLEPAR